MLHLHRHREAPVQSATSAPESLEQEQAHRIRQYLLTMTIRTACFIGAAVTATKGAPWWVWGSLAVAAVVLPYIAVVLANAVSPRAPGEVTWADPDEQPPPPQIEPPR